MNKIHQNTTCHQNQQPSFLRGYDMTHILEGQKTLHFSHGVVVGVLGLSCPLQSLMYGVLSWNFKPKKTQDSEGRPSKQDRDMVRRVPKMMFFGRESEKLSTFLVHWWDDFSKKVGIYRSHDSSSLTPQRANRGWTKPCDGLILLVWGCDVWPLTFFHNFSLRAWKTNCQYYIYVSTLPAFT